MRITLFPLLIVLSAPATAQTADPTPFQSRFDQCIHGADRAIEMEGCKGLVARLCMDETDGGHSTFGMSACNAMETGLWDDLLNADWPGHKAWAEAADEDERQYFDGQFSNRLESLIAAQRAWIAFRDAECGLAYAVWGSGSMRHVIGTACHADMTADRVIALRSLTEGMQ